MSTAPGNPRLEAVLAEVLDQQIPALAIVYDRWANALDPDAPGLDDAEKAFHQTVSHMFDLVVRGGSDEVRSLSLRDFRRHVIHKCKLHLKATSNPPTI